MSKFVNSVRRYADGTHSLERACLMVKICEALGDSRGALTCAESAYRIPVQVGDSIVVGDVLDYLHVRPYEKVFEMANSGTENFKDASEGTWWQGKKETEAFPVVKGTKDQKVNLWFKNVWKDCVKYFPEVAGYLAKDRELLGGMHNTQATAWTIWACGAYRSLGKWAFAVMRAFAKDKQALKRMNVFVKGIGVHRHEWGAQLCELKTMYGRAGNDRDADEDVRGRIDLKTFLKEKAAAVDPDQLRKSVRRIIRSEMVTQPKWQDPDEYWKKRWVTTKAGSHSKYAHRAMGVDPDLP